MVHTVFQRIAATAFGLIALTGAAAAQNYDGQGIVKFGAFSAGTWMDGTTDSALRPGGEMAGGGFGVSGGYDLIFGERLLLGAEADVSVGDISGGASPIKQQYLATLRGRLGVFITPQFLIYGTGGVAWTGLEVQKSVAAAALSTTRVDTAETVAGTALGGGLEYDLGTRWGIIVFGEYLRTTSEWSNVPGLGFKFEGEADVVRVGLKFKVGHDHRWGRWYEPAGHESLK